MKAIAVFPGKPNTVRWAELPKPFVTEVPDGRGDPHQIWVGNDGSVYAAEVINWRGRKFTLENK